MKILIEESVLRQALLFIQTYSKYWAGAGAHPQTLGESIVSALDTDETVESLRQQLAECELERDELKTWLEDQVCEAKDFAYKLESKTIELAAVTKERDKLVSALEGIASGEDSDGCITSIKYCIRTAQKALAKLGADKTGEGS